MDKKGSCHSVCRVVLMGLIWGGVFFAGCTRPELKPPVLTQYHEVLPSSLSALTDAIMANAMAFSTLRADCEAIIANPRIRREGKFVHIADGRLLLVKPKKIKLVLKGGGETYIELVGDGERYKVRMPIFGSRPYGGAYGDPIGRDRDRLHFMPDDLADALDLHDIFDHKIQMLRNLRSHWLIDSIEVPEDLADQLRVVNSVRLTKTTGAIDGLDKYTEGILRVSVAFTNWRLVAGPGDDVATIPGEIVIMYPVENTLITLRLSDIQIDVPIPEEEFSLAR